MSLELYRHLLERGRKTICKDQDCGDEFRKQLQDLHDFVYVVESTPHPEDPTYSFMFLDCLVHKSYLKTCLQHDLVEKKLSYDILDYERCSRQHHHLLDTPKRKLLFEMVGKWWFFRDTMPPPFALTEAAEFQRQFFRQKYAYLPEKFRKLTETMDFNEAIQSLTEKEHEYLDFLVYQVQKPLFLCGCLPIRKNSFSRRLDDDQWVGFELPILTHIELDEIKDALFQGEFVYMLISNHYNCLDRNLYKTLYDIFQQQEFPQKKIK